MSSLSLRVIFVGLWAFLLFSGHAQSDPVPSYVKYERQRALRLQQFKASAFTADYDWVFQRLMLDVDPSSDSLKGETVVYFTFHSPSASLSLDFAADMPVLSVEYHGMPVSYTRNADDELRIVFPDTVPQGVLDSVYVRYAGIPRSTGFGGYSISYHNGMPSVWTLSEPYAAKEWWPCKQDLTDKADSIEVVLRYPARLGGRVLRGVSNGLRVEEHEENGTKISRWRHRYPIPAYLVAIAVSDYAFYRDSAGIYTSFPIDNYVYPEDSSYAALITPVTRDVMNLFENYFGEYPFSREKYGHAQFGWGGGMEHTTITFLGDFTRGLIAHELAHQWFGDDVTCGSWSDIWLNEGFATYAEALTREAFDGTSAFRNWRRNALASIRTEPHESVYVYGNDTLNIYRLFSWPLSYLKGAMVLHMLRFRTGDSLFFEILRRYRESFHYSYARTSDLEAVIDTLTGEDYGEFFRDWVYGKGFPSFRIHWGQTASGEYEVRVEEIPSDPSVSFFETPLKLRFSQSDGQIFDTIVFVSGQGQVFHVSAEENFTRLEADPDFDLIRGEVEILKAPELSVSPAEVAIFPNPADDILFWEPKHPTEILYQSIRDATGREVVRLPAEARQLDVRRWPAGMYVLILHWRSKPPVAVKFLVK